MQKTFTQLVKLEILEADRTYESTVLFLLGFFKINGTLNSGKLKLRILDDDTRDITTKLINKTFNTRVTLKDKNIFVNENVLPEDFNTNISDIELETEEEYKDYITGLFFGKGYISSPVSKYYHLEIRMKKFIDAANVAELLITMGFNAKIQPKNKQYRVYLKKSDHISDLLAAFNSPTYSMVYIDQKIQRDFNATISRQNAIDVRNQEKVAVASVKHQQACRKILSNLVKYPTSKEEQRIAELRIKYPELSNMDLAWEYNDLYVDHKSKSTINRWLNNIVRIVNEVDSNDN